MGIYLMSSSQETTHGSDSVRESSRQWAEIIGQLFDRLTGKEASVTYTFDNLVIDIPKAQGPGGQELGGAKWTINGKVAITAETHKAVSDMPTSRVATSA